MYEQSKRDQILSELRGGASLNALYKRWGVQRSTIRAWRDTPGTAVRVSDCPRCEASTDLDTFAYVHLLGLYLGDGCVSRLRKGVFSLRITCDTKYPLLIREATASMQAVRPLGRVFIAHKQGCVDVTGSWKHWPCLFPQHGPGVKHRRRIRLEPWQVELSTRHPGLLLRGLFHSDRCRVTNWTIKELSAGAKRYEYPRYFFSNESTDIMAICTTALDQLSISWRMPRPNSLSVARKNSVAILDEHVGPKS